MKKVALLLVALLIFPMLLTACDSESQDTAKDFMNAVLKNDAEKVQEYACDDFAAEATGLYDMLGIEEGHAIRNISLKYDVGKGNNAEEITVTGSYDLVELNSSGKVVADSEEEYVLAASTRDKRDLNKNEDDTEKLNSRILLEMKEDGDDWCVESLEGGYWNPEFEDEDEEDAADTEEMEDAAADEEDAAADTEDDAASEETDEAATDDTEAESED